MLPRHGMHLPIRHPQETRRVYALPPRDEQKSDVRAVSYPEELGMLVRLGAVVLAGLVATSCLMWAAA